MGLAHEAVGAFGKVKAWGGRFGKETDKMAEEFTSSVDFDKRLYRQDIRGSIAHARMLAAQGIIAADESELIANALREIEKEIEAGSFPFSSEHEDVHMNVERRLIEKIGEAGGKLHTARSRNDQVALDMHLYVMEEIDDFIRGIARLQEALVHVAESNISAVMPGYTHLQRAQPVLLAHHLMAYFWMLQRDRERLTSCRERADMMPLGAAALAGTSFPIDPKRVAAELGFSRTYENSMDAVSDRDFVIEFAFNLTLIMMHLSRLCEELVLWSSGEFGFVELPDEFSTGSSIMPQKKNPDVPELVRGKTGRVYGNLIALLTLMKGLPLAYNRDMQEDKEPLFDSVDTVLACLDVMAEMLPRLRFSRSRLEEAAVSGFSTATDLTDYLTRKGVPFREAHRVVGGLVKRCIEDGKRLTDVGPEELKGTHPAFDDDALQLVDARASVESRRSPGGTSPEQVLAQIGKARSLLGVTP